MQVIPAIDILGGKCVRLFKGDYSNKKVYDSDPASVAFNWQSQGAILIHVVDLDGAREGRPVNTDAIASILASVDTPIQVGGGIRSFESAARLLEAGVERVVLGTSAVADPDLLKELVDSFTPRRVVVGIDAKAGKVATTG
ncbi:MAG: HisA/HisF-related TIM barrel protein, partial [Bacillota bacterium]